MRIGCSASGWTRLNLVAINSDTYHTYTYSPMFCRIDIRWWFLVVAPVDILKGETKRLGRLDRIKVWFSLSSFECEKGCWPLPFFFSDKGSISDFTIVLIKYIVSDGKTQEFFIYIGQISALVCFNCAYYEPTLLRHKNFAFFFISLPRLWNSFHLMD